MGARLDEVERRLRLVERDLARLAGHAPFDEPGEARAAAAPSAEGAGDGRLGRLLASAALLCAVLVVALFLRTSADQRWIDRSLAAGLGLAYCAALVAAGAVLFHLRRRSGGLLVSAGAVLGQLLLVENYHRFASVSAAVALGALGLLAAAAAAIGGRFGSRAVVVLGFVGSAGVAAFLDLPNLPLAWVGWWLVGATAAASWVAARSGWGAVRWLVFVPAVVVGIAWASFRQAEGPAEPRVAGLGAFLVIQAIVSLSATAGRFVRGGRPAAFEAAIPLLGPGASLGIGWWAFGGSAAAPFGVAAALLPAAAGILRGLRDRAAPGVAGALLFAAAVFAVWWMPLLVARPSVHAGLLAACGPALMALAQRGAWRTPRVLAHLLQAAVVVRLVGSGATGVVPPPAGAEAVAAGLMVAVAAVGQYAWSRLRPPPAAGLLGEMDARDRLALAPFVAGLVAAFAAVRVAGFLWLGSGDGFTVFQSIAVASLVGLLLLWSLWRRAAEARWVAVCALVLVAAKIAFWDLFVLPPGHAMASVAALAGVTGAAALVARRRR